jgi:hypothetical protein
MTPTLSPSYPTGAIGKSEPVLGERDSYQADPL